MRLQKQDGGRKNEPGKYPVGLGSLDFSDRPLPVGRRTHAGTGMPVLFPDHGVRLHVNYCPGMLTE